MLAQLSDKDFNRLSRLITETCGIRMPESKRTMVQGRLQKRLRQLRVQSMAEYCDYLFSNEGMEDELIPMIDIITTNKTDFFREPSHFEFLANKAAPEIVQKRGAGLDSPIRIWSAGCSTGEEPYTLAMVMSEFAEGRGGFRFSVLASDISTKVIETAARAVYKSDKVQPVSQEMKKKYLLRSKDRDSGLVRVAPEVRGKVEFVRINLVEDYDIGERMDIIFCRNVLIYFDREIQKAILGRLARFLRHGGYLFVGHSETLNGLGLELTHVAPSVYRKD